MLKAGHLITHGRLSFCRSSCQRRASSVVQFPYGESDIKSIVEKKKFFVDNTQYIAQLERSGEYTCLWRPRRFGKTLFCSMLSYYHDKAVTCVEVRICVHV